MLFWHVQSCFVYPLDISHGSVYMILFWFWFTCRSLIVNIGDLLERWTNCVFRYHHLLLLFSPKSTLRAGNLKHCFLKLFKVVWYKEYLSIFFWFLILVYSFDSLSFIFHVLPTRIKGSVSANALLLQLADLHYIVLSLSVKRDTLWVTKSGLNS